MASHIERPDGAGSSRTPSIAPSAFTVTDENGIETESATPRTESTLDGSGKNIVIIIEELDPPEHPDPGPPPNGGLRAWLQVLAGIMSNCLTWGFLTSFGVFQSYYTSQLLSDYSPSAISWIGGLQVFLLLSVAFFSGRAADAGHTKPMVAVGSGFIVCGIFATSYATEYYQILLALGVCVGLGCGLIYGPVLTVVGTYWSTRRASAAGIAASGAGVGGAIFPAMISFLLPRVGFGWAVRCSGLVALFFAVILNVCLRPRLPPRKSGPLIDWPAFREVPYTLYTLGIFFNFWGLFVAFTYIDLYARTTAGFSDSEAVTLIIIMNAIGVPARLAACIIADRWLGPLNTMIPASFSMAVTLYCWAAVKDRAGLYAFSVMSGISYSATTGLFSSTVASISDDLSHLGVRLGMVFAMVSLSSLTGGPIAGAIVEMGIGNYMGAQLWSGSTIAVGAAFLVATRLSKSGWVWKAKV